MSDSIRFLEIEFGAVLGAQWPDTWGLFNALKVDSELQRMADSVSPAEIALLTANKVLTLEHTRKKDKISFGPVVLVAVFAQPFVHVVF